MLDVTIEVVASRDIANKAALHDQGCMSRLLSRCLGGAAADDCLIDATADMIGSKGTGLWSVVEALDVGVPVPSLAQAVLVRQMSMLRPERLANAARLPTQTTMEISKQEVSKCVDELYWAVYLSIVASYAQMFQALRAMDKAHELEIAANLPRIISTFRAGCILQGAILEPMTKAFEAEPDIPNMMCAFREEIQAGLSGMRDTCSRAALGGEPVPVMQSSLSYITTMSLPLIQAAQVVSLQRDVFGRHGFKRLAQLELGKGTDAEVKGELLHADWPEMVP